MNSETNRFDANRNDLLQELSVEDMDTVTGGISLPEVYQVLGAATAATKAAGQALGVMPPDPPPQPRIYNVVPITL